MEPVSHSSETSEAGKNPVSRELIREDEEQRLIKACQEGDSEAFDQLIRTFQDQVFGLAFHLLRDHDEAEDLAQEVFLSCYRNLHSFRFESRLGTWLYRITVNRVKNRWKYHQRRQRDKHESLDAPRSDDDVRSREVVDPTANPREQAEGREMMRILESRITELSPDFQQVIGLRFGQSLSYEEIAEVLDCSIGTVKSRINRARGQLREKMRDVL